MATAGDSVAREAAAGLDGGAATVERHRALIVVNPVAGAGAADLVRQVLGSVFGAAGWEYRVYLTTGHDNFRELVRTAIEAGDDVVVACGGDGTIAEVGDALIGTPLSLGIVPIGTGNVLSQALGIPQVPALAAQLIVDPHHVCELDAMQVGDEHFLLQIGVGLDSLMIRNTDRPMKRRFGRLAYMITLARLLFGYQSRRYELIIDGRRRRVKALDVLVANVGILGIAELHWSPNIRPTDGELDVIVVNVQRFSDYVRFLWRLLMGLPRRGPSVTIYPVRDEVTIIPRRKLPVQADGEIIGRAPVTVRIEPHAIRVIVPVDCPIEQAADDVRAAVGREKAVRRQTRLRKWLGPVGVVDSSAALLVNALPHPPILNLLMEAIATVMQRGDGWLIWLAAALHAEHRSWRVAIDVAPALWLTDIAVEGVLKRIFRRPRPFIAKVLAPVVGRKPGSHSFPSGHAASAFAGAWLLSRRFPKATKGLFAFATLVAFSRMYLGVHYLSDVVVGAASGVAFAAGFRMVVRLGLGTAAKKLGR
jgi:YegS/Rv2252/BmrU family lipid kinase